MSNAFVADKAMHALKNLAWRNGADGRTADAGGCAVVVVRVLVLLVSRLDIYQHVSGTGQKSVLDSDGVRITVRCMEEHPDNMELQKQACSVLRVLTATDSRVVSALQKKSVGMWCCSLYRHLVPDRLPSPIHRRRVWAHVLTMEQSKSGRRCTM